MMTVAAALSSRPPLSTSRDERGASAVEYAMLLVGIAAVIVIVIFALGGSVFGLFDDSCGSLAAQSGTNC
jgi:pilus assembly protein Flp/PilA